MSCKLCGKALDVNFLCLRPGCPFTIHKQSCPILDPRQRECNCGADTSLLGALDKLLCFCVSSDRYNHENPYLIGRVKGALEAWRRATNTEHSLAHPPEFNLETFQTATQTLIEDACDNGLDRLAINDVLKQLAGVTPSNYAGLVTALAADVLASCECKPAEGDLDAYIQGLAADLKVTLEAAHGADQDED